MPTGASNFSRPLGPERPQDRFAVYRFFNGISAEGKEGIDAGRTRVPLVKTFLLEHVAGSGRRAPKPVPELWRHLGAEVAPIDESFFTIIDDFQDTETKKSTRKAVGFVEAYDQRFFAFYTCEKSADAKRRVSRWIQDSNLDATWFSSPLLQTIWQEDLSRRGEDRFAKLVFKHESIFEMPSDFAEQTAAGVDEEEFTPDNDSSEEGPEPERRNARFEMGDRIGRIKESLDNLQTAYDPMNALHSLRIPSQTTTGGHDLYQHGQVTNRTGAFEDHRNTVRYLYRIYKSVLDYTERQAWQHFDQAGEAATRHMQTGGAPLIVHFHPSLSKETFERWINMAFQKRNRFKLWGQPIRMGPTKIHVYGADRHLWQPINMEITAGGLVALLPRGTCGNTFHRLVANIQHYVSPKIDVWLGSERFDSVVRKWPQDLEVADVR